MFYKKCILQWFVLEDLKGGQDIVWLTVRQVGWQWGGRRESVLYITNNVEHKRRKRYFLNSDFRFVAVNDYPCHKGAYTKIKAALIWIFSKTGPTGPPIILELLGHFSETPKLWIF